jgi:RNA polymerase sigma-70 factor (ECF subfamily)
VEENVSSTAAQEAEWIRAAKEGDREAFDALVELHGRCVLRYLRNMCTTMADAEDLAQDVLYQAYRRLSTFRDGSNFRSWLLTIAYHAWVHSKRRKRATEKPTEMLENVAAPAGDTGPGELSEALQACLSQLPEDQRTVVMLRFGEGLSHANIAKITKADPSTVRWRLFRARQTLRKVLAAWVPKKQGVKTDDV